MSRDAPTMAVQLNIPYETLVELVEQLPPEQQQDLAMRLLDKKKDHALSKAEWKALFESMTLDLGEVLPGYSDRREDWYDADGR
jgi:hypothetical protein